MIKKPLYKSTGKLDFFSEENRTKLLEKLGNPLKKLKELINFEIFRTQLEEVIIKKNRKSNAGARLYDPILMLKIIVLQTYHCLSDEQTEYQIVDRQSFRDFLNLKSGDKVPDAKTIWWFREILKNNELIEKIFAVFVTHLESKGFVYNKGQIIDSSFVEAPRQRNIHEENEKIKNGEGDTLWNDNFDKKCQKDIDARWTKKNEETYFGYKDHVKVDSGSKLITKYTVTSASVHDSQELKNLLTEKDAGQLLFADSAYTGEKQEETIENREMTNKVHEKGKRNCPLTEEQKAENKEKSKIRARVEHVFGFMTNSMNSLYIKTKGIERAQCVIGLMNLTYNFFRYVQLEKIELSKVVK